VLILLPLLLCVGLVLPAEAGLPKIPKPKILRKPAPAKPTGDPVAWLARVDATKAEVQAAEDCLNRSRDVVFRLGATKEEQRILEEMNSRVEAAESTEDREEAVAAVRSYQDETVRRAREEGRYEQKQLDKQQRRNTGKLVRNLGLAALNDRKALANGKALLEESDDVVKNAKKPKNMIKLGKNLKRVVAAPKDLRRIISTLPGQIEALNNLLAASRDLKKNNEIEEPPAAESGDSYETVEDF